MSTIHPTSRRNNGLVSETRLSTPFNKILATPLLDYGSGNHQMYIGVSKLAAILEEKKPGITEALIGFHALTLCFFRKGKVLPFQWLEEEPDYIMALKSLTKEEVLRPLSACYMVPNIQYIVETRYKALCPSAVVRGKNTWLE